MTYTEMINILNGLFIQSARIGFKHSYSFNNESKTGYKVHNNGFTVYHTDNIMNMIYDFQNEMKQFINDNADTINVYTEAMENKKRLNDEMKTTLTNIIYNHFNKRWIISEITHTHICMHMINENGDIIDGMNFTVYYNMHMNNTSDISFNCGGSGEFNFYDKDRIKFMNDVTGFINNRKLIDLLFLKYDFYNKMYYNICEEINNI